jgi:hypothetical protein
MPTFGKIIVGNLRKGASPIPPGFTQIRVDRENPILGNKYILHDWRDDDERYDVLFDYKGDYDDDWDKNGPMKQETLKIARRVYKGESVALMCWCAGKPTYKPCHAEFIKDRIEETLKPYIKQSYENGKS